MARVVESVVPEFGESLTWEKVVTRELNGARRQGELSKSLGRPAPVPSIFIDGKLVYDQTPGVEELRGCIAGHLSESQGDGTHSSTA